MTHLAREIFEVWKGAYLRRTLSRKQIRRPVANGAKSFLFILLNAIGDAIMAQPVWSMLKSVLPQARIELLCRPQISVLFTQDKSLYAVHTFDADPHAWWNPRNVDPIEALWRKQKYDVILDFTEIPLTAAACARETAPPSVGFDRLPDRFGKTMNLSCAYDHAFPYTDSDPIREVMLGLASPWIPSTVNRPVPSLAIREETLDRAASGLRKRGLEAEGFITLHPGAKWPPKRWPVSHWSKLIQRIQESSSWSILLLGGNQDESLIHSILHEGGAPPVPFLLCEDLSTAAEILSLSALCVCNDSAAMHIAAAVGTPSISLFGPVSPSKSAPSEQEGCRPLYEGLFCSPCTLYYSRDRCRRGLNFCMHAISPERVYCEIEKMVVHKEGEVS